jgi:hypothetical protein
VERESHDSHRWPVAPLDVVEGKEQILIGGQVSQQSQEGRAHRQLICCTLRRRGSEQCHLEGVAKWT